VRAFLERFSYAIHDQKGFDASGAVLLRVRQDFSQCVVFNKDVAIRAAHAVKMKK
jgi:hypothetical protein